MKILVIAAGKPALDYAKSGIAEYLKRLGRQADVELKIVKAGDSDSVSRRLLDASEGCLRIALDERGQQWSTREFAAKVDSWQLSSVKKIAFLIGASDGHSEELRQQVDLTLGICKWTLQHELALLVLLEQIYRVFSLLKGEPYHRD